MPRTSTWTRLASVAPSQTGSGSSTTPSSRSTRRSGRASDGPDLRHGGRARQGGIMVRVVASLTLWLAACAGGGAGRESNPWEELGPGKESGPVFLLGGTVRHVELEGGL